MTWLKIALALLLAAICVIWIIDPRLHSSWGKVVQVLGNGELLSQLQEKFSEGGANLHVPLNTAVNDINNFNDNILNSVKGFTGRVLSGLYTELGGDQVLNAVSGPFSSGWNWLSTRLPSWSGSIYGWLSGVPGFNSTADSAKSALGAAWGWMNTNIPNWSVSVSTWLSSLPGLVGTLAGGAESAIKERFWGTWDWLNKHVPGWPVAIWNWLSELPGTIDH